MEDLRTEHDVEEALRRAARRGGPGLRRAVVKLNDSFSGEGNALFRYPEERRPGRAARGAAPTSSSRCPRRRRDAYFDKFARMGGIVEEFIEAPEKASPSAQLRISPRGEVLPISTHDQILGGPSGQVFLGCSFPAHDDYRHAHPGGGARDRRGAGRPRRGQPLRGRLPASGATTRPPTGSVAALEINLRMGGTTHPYLALQFLTGGQLDPRDRPLPLAHRPRQVLPRHRQPAAPSLPRPAARGPDRHPHRQQAPLQPRHRVGRALPPDRRRSREFGKLGLTAIANSREEVDDLYQRDAGRARPRDRLRARRGLTARGRRRAFPDGHSRQRSLVSTVRQNSTSSRWISGRASER